MEPLVSIPKGNQEKQLKDASPVIREVNWEAIRLFTSHLILKITYHAC